MQTIYLINEVINEYQWIGLPEEDEDVGIRLAKVGFNSIRADFNPIKVEWLPETMNRMVCDFPNFRPQFTCMSRKAIDCLVSIIDEAGEFIELCGVEVDFEAFHCLAFYDALDQNRFDEMQKNDRFLSISKPDFLPPLRKNKIGKSNIFHIQQSKNKFFVTQAFKDIYENNLMTGLSFKEVSVFDD